MKQSLFVFKIIEAFCFLISLIALYIFWNLLAYSLYGGTPPQWMQSHFSPDAVLAYWLLTLCSAGMIVIFGYCLFRSRL